MHTLPRRIYQNTRPGLKKCLWLIQTMPETNKICEKKAYTIYLGGVIPAQEDLHSKQNILGDCLSRP